MTDTKIRELADRASTIDAEVTDLREQANAARRAIEHACDEMRRLRSNADITGQPRPDEKLERLAAKHETKRQELEDLQERIRQKVDDRNRAQTLLQRVQDAANA